MKIYNIIRPGCLEEGILPSSHEGNAFFIDIGDEGRGRTLVKIPINGATGAEERITNVKVGKIGSMIVLESIAPEGDDDSRMLARINTVGGYDRYREYTIYDEKRVEILAKGFIAFGDAGRVNGGPDLLALLGEGSSFRLKSKYEEYYYRVKGGELIVETTSMHYARLAIESVAKGEVEWL